MLPKLHFPAIEYARPVPDGEGYIQRGRVVFSHGDFVHLENLCIAADEKSIDATAGSGDGEAIGPIHAGNSVSQRIRFTLVVNGYQDFESSIILCCVDICAYADITAEVAVRR